MKTTDTVSTKNKESICIGVFMELLKKFYAINSKSGNEGAIKEFFIAQLAGLELVVEEDTFGNVFITKGVADSYPCVSAHFDEVHSPVEKRIVHEGEMIFAVDDGGEFVTWYSAGLEPRKVM